MTNIFGDLKDMMLQKASAIGCRGPREGVKTHDFTQSRWGWSIAYVHDIGTKEPRYSILGIGLGIQVGDSILLKTQNGRICRYEILEINYKRDPADMWEGKMEAKEFV
jgi:hypothetical protein